MNVGENNVIVVAHPDDEILWAGGLPIRYCQYDWTIICCSIPQKDPIRAEKFFNVCEELDVVGIRLPHTETAPWENLKGVEQIDLSCFDCIFTHNSEGEYGHRHHCHVHDVIVERWWPKKQLVTFGMRGQEAKGKERIELDENELKIKLSAFKRYNYPSPYDGLPQWEHLLKVHKYIDLAVETYDVH